MEQRPDTLEHVLYVRAPQALVAALDREVARQRVAAPGHTVSRADVVREAIHWYLTHAQILSVNPRGVSDDD